MVSSDFVSSILCLFISSLHIYLSIYLLLYESLLISNLGIGNDLLDWAGLTGKEGTLGSGLGWCQGWVALYLSKLVIFLPLGLRGGSKGNKPKKKEKVMWEERQKEKKMRKELSSTAKFEREEKRKRKWRNSKKEDKDYLVMFSFERVRFGIRGEWAFKWEFAVEHFSFVFRLCSMNSTIGMKREARKRGLKKKGKEKGGKIKTFLTDFFFLLRLA